MNKPVSASSSRQHPLFRVPIIVWIGLLCAITLDTVVQMLWKGLVNSIPEDIAVMDAVRLILIQPYFYYLLGLFTSQFFCWMILLGKADLAYIKPFTTLSLVTVAAAAAMLYNEQVCLMRMVGIIMIIVGVWIVSGTDHKTTAADAPTVGQKPEGS